MGKKKSYNPFKMWGSYVGLIIGLAIAYSFEFTRVMSGGNPNPLFSNIVKNMLGFSAVRFFPLLLLITVGIISAGFLIGWGIHSIFRAVNN